MKQAIKETLARMTPENRRVLLLYYRGGLGLRTIAETYGRSLAGFYRHEWREACAEFRRIYEK